jgi:hypothetical protein
VSDLQPKPGAGAKLCSLRLRSPNTIEKKKKKQVISHFQICSRFNKGVGNREEHSPDIFVIKDLQIVAHFSR